MEKIEKTQKLNLTFFQEFIKIKNKSNNKIYTNSKPSVLVDNVLNILNKENPLLKEIFIFFFVQFEQIYKNLKKNNQKISEKDLTSIIKKKLENLLFNLIIGDFVTIKSFFRIWRENEFDLIIFDKNFYDKDYNEDYLKLWMDYKIWIELKIPFWKTKIRTLFNQILDYSKFVNFQFIIIENKFSSKQWEQLLGRYKKILELNSNILFIFI